MNNSIYPDDALSSKSVIKMRKGMIGNWINTNSQDSSTAHGTSLSIETTNDPASIATGRDADATLAKLRQSAEGYMKRVDELWAQSSKTSNVNWPDPTEDERWRTKIGTMIETLTEDMTVDLEVKNKVSGLRASCQTQFDEITQLKKRNSMIEPYRLLLNRANDLTRSTISTYHKILNGTSSGGAKQLDGQFREMVKSHNEVNRNSSKINQAVRLVAQQGLKKGYTDIGVDDDSDTDTDSEDEYRNRHHYAQGETYEFNPQEHELITEIESWTQSKLNVQNAGFRSELMDLLPKKYKSLLTSGLASSKGDMSVYKVFKA